MLIAATQARLAATAMRRRPSVGLVVAAWSPAQPSPPPRTTTLQPRRAFSRSSAAASQSINVSGLIYDTNGDPRSLVRAHNWTVPSRLAPGQVRLRVVLASVNPADINVIQGVYPTRPQKRDIPGVEHPVFVGGNEGVAVVEGTAAGDSTDGGGLVQGDWVVFGTPQMGTWQSHIICANEDVVKIERSAGDAKLTPVMASTLQVNPATAYRMLSDFVTLDPSRDAIIQNAANSAVGQAVAQIASRHLGIPSINLVRDRPDLDALRATFRSYGNDDESAAHIFTYEALRDKKSGAKEQIREILGKRSVRLGFNALCGPDNENMTKFLSKDATLVTYGAMSKQPFSMPAGLLIFHNVSVRGFMMNKWYAQNPRQERQRLMQTLVQWYEQGILEPPPHDIVELQQNASPDEITRKAREAITQSMAGMGGKKVFFKFT